MWHGSWVRLWFRMNTVSDLLLKFIILKQMISKNFHYLVFQNGDKYHYFYAKFSLHYFCVFYPSVKLMQSQSLTVAQKTGYFSNFKQMSIIWTFCKIPLFWEIKEFQLAKKASHPGYTNLYYLHLYYTIYIWKRE